MPDFNFSTVKSPNPEEIEAFNIATEIARKENANIIIGTDPDCDRVGVIVKNKQNEYICKLRYLMSLDDTSLCYMRNNAIKKSELYDINKVVFEWEKLFNELI